MSTFYTDLSVSIVNILLPISLIISLILILIGIIVYLSRNGLRIRRMAPKYYIGTGPEGLKLTLRKARLAPNRSHGAFKTGQRLFYPIFLSRREDEEIEPTGHVVYFPIHIGNDGTEPITNLQVQLSYPEKHVCDMDDIKHRISESSAQSFDSTGRAFKVSAEYVPTTDNVPKRYSTTALGYTQVIYEIDVVRMGGGPMIIYEPLWMPHSGSSLFSDIKLRHSGYDAVAKELQKLSFIKNNMPIIAHFRSASHSEIIRKTILFTVHGDIKDFRAEIDQYARAYWLKGDLDFASYVQLVPFGWLWILRRLRLVGTLSRGTTRYCSIVVHSTSPIYFTQKNGAAFSVDDIQPSVVGYGKLTLPNVDPFELPDGIENTQHLLHWLGCTAFSTKLRKGFWKWVNRK
jgi:hypothetical protein